MFDSEATPKPTSTSFQTFKAARFKKKCSPRKAFQTFLQRAVIHPPARRRFQLSSRLVRPIGATPGPPSCSRGGLHRREAPGSCWPLPHGLATARVLREDAPRARAAPAVPPLPGTSGQPPWQKPLRCFASSASTTNGTERLRKVLTPS